VLLVEDNRLDVFLVREALAQFDLPVVLHVAQDGEAATRYFDALDARPDAPVPQLVLLDLNLPKRTGLEVLSHLRRSQRCADVKVLLVSSSDSPADKAEIQRLGVFGYFRKPPSYEGFLTIGEIVRNILEGSSRH
jgi:two-component system, chemotaxis family, response regulator Rcp1